MNVSFNPAIPGFVTDFTRPVVAMRSRRFLILLTALLTICCCSLMFSALLGTERYLVFVADYTLATAAIIGCTALGICGAIGGSFSTIILIAMRKA